MFVENRYNWAVLNDDRNCLAKVVWSKLCMPLRSDLFCQINQSRIIAGNMIERANPISSRRYALTLSQRYERVDDPHLKPLASALLQALWLDGKVILCVKMI